MRTSDGERVPADQKIDGAPSVLYDAVVILASQDGGAELAAQPAARDFVTDAFAHCKFVGYVSDAAPLFQATGIDKLMDSGFIEIGKGTSDAAGFLPDRPAAALLGTPGSRVRWPSPALVAKGQPGRAGDQRTSAPSRATLKGDHSWRMSLTAAG